MGLDIYLLGEESTEDCQCPNCGNRHKTKEREELFSADITHNITMLADKAGIYKCLWRPKENGVFKAEDLIQPLEKGLARLMKNPEKFKKYNSSNGFGTYKQFVPWVEECLRECRKHPKAKIETTV